MSVALEREAQATSVAAEVALVKVGRWLRAVQGLPASATQEAATELLPQAVAAVVLVQSEAMALRGQSSATVAQVQQTHTPDHQSLVPVVAVAAPEALPLAQAAQGAVELAALTTQPQPLAMPTVAAEEAAAVTLPVMVEMVALAVPASSWCGSPYDLVPLRSPTNRINTPQLDPVAEP
jgi:hypothetical protein